MAKRSKERGPYKKQLSIFEVKALAEERKDSPVFVTNRKGERSLEPWLKELRFRQAYQVAVTILGEEIAQYEFESCWGRTVRPKPKKEKSSAPPNTATFGGYRHRGRASLGRGQQTNAPKKRGRRW